MPIKKNSLGSSEKIKSKKLIDAVFDKSAFSAAAFPFVSRYTVEPHSEGSLSVLVGFSVSKRHYKKAVDRNKIKRWMREAYRKNKEILSSAAEAHNASVYLFFMLQKPLTIMNYHDVEARIVKLLEGVKKGSLI